jgi:hypothetical protein
MLNQDSQRAKTPQEQQTSPEQGKDAASKATGISPQENVGRIFIVCGIISSLVLAGLVFWELIGQILPFLSYFPCFRLQVPHVGL